MRSFDVHRAFEAAALAAVSALAVSCTTLGKPAEQTIRVETPDCVRASCELSNDRGTWRLDTTPGEVSIVTSKENLLERRRRGQGGGSEPDRVSVSRGDPRADAVPGRLDAPGD